MTYSVEGVKTLLTVVRRSLEPSYRIVCFPHGGGGVQSFRGWSEYLPDDVELICLDLPGRGKRLADAAIRSMDLLASMVTEALGDYSDRPFMFFGHSTGALVAYEVARWLESAGRASPFHVVVSAHKSADVPADQPSLHQYADEELTELVRTLGLVPPEALANEELVKNFILPPLKADFELAEGYDRSRANPINAALTAMGGLQDELVNENDLGQWHRLTRSRFSRIMFDGDHFYINSATANVVSTLLSESEEVKEQLPVSVHIAEVLPYSDLPLHDQLRKQAALRPEAPAVLSVARTLSYRELDDLSEALSRQLLGYGCVTGSHVGILMDTSLEYPIAQFGILKAGAAFVALDKALPPAALMQILEKAAVEIVVTNKEFSASLPHDWTGGVLSLDESWEAQLSARGPAKHKLVDLDAPAQIAFSSGTTGEPKGIICTHRSAAASYERRTRALPYLPDEREAVNIFLVWEIMRPILAGVPVYLVPDDVIYDPHQLVDYLESNAISRALFTPSLLNVLLGSGVLTDSSRLPDLHLIYLSGEVVTAALVARARHALPHVKIINIYGVAETQDVAHIDLSQIDPAITQKVVPVGAPQQNVSVYVLGEQRKPVPLGFLGEIFVGGETLGPGYLNSPEMTRDRFLPDPFRTEGTMFRTGDLGRMLAGGQLEIIGRCAFMVKIRGYSVVPGAVEAALLRHSNVSSAAVVPELDPETSQPDRLIAYVVLGREFKGWQDSLRSHLKFEIPHYAIPSKFVPVKELPIAASGKLDRSRLHDVHACAPVAGADEVDIALGAAWRALLQADAADEAANFFDCGGHSLLAARLCTQLRETLEVKLRVVEVYLHPTFKELATLLRKRRGELRGSPSGKLSQKAMVSESEGTAKTANRQRDKSVDIAVIGMAARFPGAQTVDELWENLCQGICSIVQLSEQELRARGIPEDVLRRPDYVRMGAHLDEVDLFDPHFWGLSPHEATLMDPQHRLFLECCWKALESAGYTPTDHEGRTGVFAGSFLPLYLLHYLKGGGLCDPTDALLAWLTELGNDKDYLALRASYMLNLHGPSIVVQSSCSTGLVAIASAAQSLAAGHCDMALAGAASISFPQAGYQYVEGFINSSDGACRAFDADASGTVGGDGVGVVVLKRLCDAQAAGDPVLAVVKGCAINNDGRAKSSFSAPSVQGQAAVVSQALESAGLSPADIEYIETHGTGTKIGDPIEVRALAEVFAGQQANSKTCALGSIKPNIGHSNIAAGIASFIKVVQSVRRGLIPPTININHVSADLNLEETPFFVNERLRAWPRKPGQPRTAGVTSLGVGGTNCHVVLQEWIDNSERAWPGSASRGSYVLCLSAKTPSALSRACHNLASFLQRNRDIDLADVAHTLGVARCHFDHRTAVVVANVGDAIKKLEAESYRMASRTVSPPSIAFMLPGGGVQYPGMFKELFEHVPDFREAFLHCAAASRSIVRGNLESLVMGDEHAYVTASFEEINIMIFSVQYAMAHLLGACGVRPDYLVGHSMGEYVAATLAGILKTKDAITLMVTRARAMAKLGVDGAMLAAKCSPEEAERILAGGAWHDRARCDEICVGVVNSKTSVVFTGIRELIETLHEELDRAEIPNQILNTSGVPSHSPLMKPAGDAIDVQLRKLEQLPPNLPIALNVGGYLHPAKVPLPDAYWSRQARETIRFDRSLSAIMEAGATALIDIGPSCNLARFASEMVEADGGDNKNAVIVTAARNKNDRESNDLHAVLECLGKLWSLGADVDWDRARTQLEPSGPRRRVPIPTYSFDRHRCWPDIQQPGLTAAPHVERRKRRKGEAFTYVQAWTEKLLPRALRLGCSEKASRWLILADQPSRDLKCMGDALANTIIQQLQRSGHEVVRVSRRMKRSSPLIKTGASSITIDASRDGLKALFNAEIASDRPADRVVCLWPLSGSGGLSGDPGIVQSEFFDSYNDILELARVLSTLTFQEPIDIWIVGDRMIQVCDEVVAPEKACIFGPAIVLPQENPTVDCRVVDLNIDEPGVGDRLLAEIGRDLPGPEGLVALRGNQRWVPHFPEVTLAEKVPEAKTFRSGGVYLITGGLGRIGLSLTERLVKLGARVVSITRRTVPDTLDFKSAKLDENVWMQRLAALDGAKGRVIIRQADVSDFDSLSGALDATVREFGRLDGIFHAAGVADLRFLSEMDDKPFATEFSSKVLGTRNLYGAIKKMQSTHAQTPEFVFLFSSLASILGGPAMADFAAATAFMDAFARHTSGKLGVRWINSNWDDWSYSYDERQVTSAYATSEARDLALSADEGMDIIERILATIEDGQVIIATRPLPPRTKQWREQVRVVLSDGPANWPISCSEEVRKTQSDDQWKEAFLREVKLLLKANEITLEDNFFDVGGDSLLATALQLRLKNSERWRPPRLEEIFKASTFGNLYERIRQT
ncbi:SDR family NAD(P)-dependent oxidoreductase [Mesorhizobium australafricanum]|uniref:SDR family oxidoreductase n=1 Tax=Mesorhizobium australafricanum TaxID=3072311 RepID=A0ABU4X5I3_9HYPH|nr:SDR family NAD(P)-dependent oxidoreductase [Mesorhizobium sp. VK3E]MDX8442402.1 SDR family oxidoreductase [Mesorhizobium sp. VK3E]